MMSGTTSRTESRPRPIITIDDCIARTGELVEWLDILGQQKHPFGIRKGVILMQKDTPAQSTQLRAGARTYFFDVESTKEGDAYLKITESRYKGKEEERERTSIFIFRDKAQEFAKAVAEMAAKLG
jgi:hypothetical protein